MKCNVGMPDRILRIIVGIFIMIVGIKITSLIVKLILLIISISVLFSAMSGFCFLYKIFKVSTCKIKK